MLKLSNKKKMYKELYVAVQDQKFSRKESVSACISNYYKMISP